MKKILLVFLCVGFTACQRSADNVANTYNTPKESSKILPKLIKVEEKGYDRLANCTPYNYNEITSYKYDSDNNLISSTSSNNDRVTYFNHSEGRLDNVTFSHYPLTSMKFYYTGNKVTEVRYIAPIGWHTQSDVVRYISLKYDSNGKLTDVHFRTPKFNSEHVEHILYKGSEISRISTLQGDYNYEYETKYNPFKNLSEPVKIAFALIDGGNSFRIEDDNYIGFWGEYMLKQTNTNNTYKANNYISEMYKSNISDCSNNSYIRVNIEYN
ncbi:hypothetical protein [Riemerella anatipestifer]|uniref:DUF4595 domain-containing protein n=1 Tax=Riemerella anatipestifer TaxID=34085 RepID=A0AAP6LLB3_RIEAN|nr:hypothetical protein [Riemerella anatipestifer]MBT0548928.1 hypothetical protein [Riemerella anatipestifer]MBT0555242.1 hypothetical protein [Riemerella anatipestifer]MBT0559691.1 hypothetical protein [Riemerella anatipestifer]MCD5968024.1 hypothetical protein [Riemerella anatipestifer]MCO7354732.1 hypothetical protein [Riemerella anatipestifer]